jgi:Protein of unknown function (DUF3499)
MFVSHAIPGCPLASGIVADPPDVDRRLLRSAAVVRQCSRTGCAERAVVTLTYHYGRSHVWLDDLTPERDPHAYDLCRLHAARLSVPQGWQVDDRRRSLVIARLAV